MIKIISKHQIVEVVNKNTEKEVESEYCKEIINAIKKHCAFAAMDTLVKRRFIGGYYKIYNIDNTEKEIGEIQSNQQQQNTLKAAKAITLLNLIKNI